MTAQQSFHIFTHQNPRRHLRVLSFRPEYTQLGPTASTLWKHLRDRCCSTFEYLNAWDLSSRGDVHQLFRNDLPQSRILPVHSRSVSVRATHQQYFCLPARPKTNLVVSTSRFTPSAFRLTSAEMSRSGCFDLKICCITMKCISRPSMSGRTMWLADNA